MTQDHRSALEDIRRRTERMKRTRRRRADSPLRGLSAFGAIGWSIALPTVGGVLLGMWLDGVAPAQFSWPLALMLGGLVLGMIVAWNWVEQENRQAEEDAGAGPENKNEGEAR